MSKPLRIIAVTSDWYTDLQEEGKAPPIGGGAYYRLVLPLLALHEAGHEVFIVPNLEINRKTGEMYGSAWLPDENGNTLVQGVDVIITQRWMADVAPIATHAARSTGQVVIADLDDWYFGLPADNAAFYGTHPKVNEHVNRNHYAKHITACNAVICSTPYLADRMATWNVEKIVLRNMIALDDWEQRDTTLSGDKPTIGWTGGTFWRQRDLKEIASFVGPFIEKHGLPFAHVGHRDDGPSACDLLRIDTKKTDVALLPQCPIDDFPQAVAKAGIDVGLVPLVDVPFNHAKSCLKGMEYAASGIPFIADALPEYQHFGVGALCRRPRHWATALERMLDPTERMSLAEAARARVAGEDYRCRGAEWVDVIESLTS